MHDELRRLDNDHRNFRRLMRVFSAQIDRFDGDGNPDFTLMRDIVHYMTGYPDIFHHPAEDRVFATLVHLDPAARPQVEVVEKEHRHLTAAGLELLQLLDNVLADTVVPRDVLAQASRTYHDRILEHMRKEDESLFPLVQQRLADKDWDAIAAAAKRHEDPLFSANVDQRYATILDHLAQHP